MKHISSVDLDYSDIKLYFRKVLIIFSISQLKTECGLQAWTTTFHLWYTSYTTLLGLSPFLRITSQACLGLCAGKHVRVMIWLCGGKRTLCYLTSLTTGAGRQGYHGLKKDRTESSFHSITMQKVLFNQCT